MAAPGMLTVEEELQEVKHDFKEVKMNIKKIEGEIRKIEEARTKEGYADDPEYRRAKEDLAREKQILVELLRKETRLEENLLRRQDGVRLRPSSEAESLAVQFILQKAKEREVLAKMFTTVPTYCEIKAAVEELFPRFVREDFKLMHGKALVASEDSWRALVGSSRSKSKQEQAVQLAVVSTRKPFHAFKQEEGLSLLGVTKTINFPATFKPPELDLAKALPGKITKLTGWATGQDVVEHVSRDLAARALVSNPLNSTKEARSRELISPVLMAAIILAGGDMEMHAEFYVQGARCSGCVDWAVVYKNLNVVVVEAKLISKWEEYMGQLAAEMVGSREEYAMKELGKRKEDIDEPQVPSWGVLTTGLAYKLFKFESHEEGGGPRHHVLYESEAMSVHLKSGMAAQEVQREVLGVLAFLKHALDLQKEGMDNNAQVKRART